MIGLTADEIRDLTNGAVQGDGTRRVTRVATLENASDDALSFVAAHRYLPYLQATRAGVVLVREGWESEVPDSITAVVVRDPHLALQIVLERMYPAPAVSPGIHPTAIVAEDVNVGEGVSIGPYAVVESGCRIGPGTRIGAHTFIGPGCQIGAEVTIHPHATLYPGVRVGERCTIHSGARIGKEGFGFVWRDGGHRRIPQVGGCVLEADVEVGANSAIDRGSISDTVIGRGTKIDNLVQVGHNVVTGKNVVLCALVGISGSARIGDGAVLAGQVGVGGHLEIGARAQIAGQAGVISDVPAGATYSGYPARPHRETMRAQAVLHRLGDVLRRLKRLEEALFAGEKK